MTTNEMIAQRELNKLSDEERDLLRIIREQAYAFGKASAERVIEKQKKRFEVR